MKVWTVRIKEMTEECPCWSETKWTNYIRILGIDSEIMVYMEKFAIELISNVAGNFLWETIFV
jgi:hypothetical protein